MIKHTIPHTDIPVSEICLGSMNWAQQNSQAEAHEQLEYAVDHGVNFIDTAEIYPIPPDPEKQGSTEEFIGSWLKKRSKRDDLVLASKVGGVFQAPMIGRRDASAGLTKENIRAALDASLERLGTDYLDLYQVHVPDRRANYFGVRGYTELPDEETGAAIEETHETLTELVKEGKIRAIGVSNETPWGVNEYLRLARDKGFTPLSTIQNQYSLLNRTFEIGLSEIALREQVGLLAYSPLSGGVLSGKYLDGAKPEGARFTLFTRNSSRYNNEYVQEAVQRYVDVAKAHNIDPSALALAFCLEQPFMTSVIIGTTNLDQLATDIGAADIELTPEIREEIQAIYQELPDPHA